MKKVLIIASTIDRGGIGQYVLNLLSILSSTYECVILTTHKKGSLWESLFAYVDECYSLDRYSKLTKYYHLLRIVRKVSPDYIFNNYNACLQYVLPVLSSSIKCIHIIHSDDLRYYRIAAINANHVDAWIVPSPKIAETFNRYTYDKYKEKVKVIPHGVRDLGVVNIVVHNPFSLIFVGALFEHKGVRCLPMIIRKLLQFPDVDFHFTIIGEGPLMKHINDDLQEEILNGVVRIMGFLPSEKVYDEFRNSDCMVFPTQLESFGLVIAESMINGVVPIVTRLEGITDYIIEDGCSGFLIDKFDNLDDFVNIIYHLAKDTHHLLEMKTNSYNSAHARFSLEAMKENYISYLNQLII